VRTILIRRLPVMLEKQAPFVWPSCHPHFTSLRRTQQQHVGLPLLLLLVITVTTTAAGSTHPNLGCIDARIHNHSMHIPQNRGLVIVQGPMLIHLEDHAKVHKWQGAGQTGR
jgi:hypothetical protein